MKNIIRLVMFTVLKTCTSFLSAARTFFPFKVISVGFRLSDVNFTFAPSGLASSPPSAHGQAAFLPFNNTSWLLTRVQEQKMRVKWGTGLQPNGVQLNSSVQQTESDPPRGARSGLSSRSPGCSCVSSLQRQNACLWGLQVNCSWGTERRKSHHRTRRDYRLLNAED